jgi:hypothetical protein
VTQGGRTLSVFLVAAVVAAGGGYAAGSFAKKNDGANGSAGEAIAVEVGPDSSAAPQLSKTSAVPSLRVPTPDTGGAGTGPVAPEASPPTPGPQPAPQPQQQPQAEVPDHGE